MKVEFLKPYKPVCFGFNGKKKRTKGRIEFIFICMNGMSLLQMGFKFVIKEP